MPQITVNADCDHAPKKQRLRDLNIAFARADVEAILALFSEDITWHIVGEFRVEGKAAARAALETMRGVETPELLIHSILTQGREGVVHGVITTAEGRSYAFCDICQFSSAAGEQIQTLTSYAIETNEGV